MMSIINYPSIHATIIIRVMKVYPQWAGMCCDYYVLIIYIKENISNYDFTYTYVLVPFPPLPGPTPHISPMVVTESNSSGQYFFCRVTHQQTFNDSSSIDSVSINGRPHQRILFDANS